MSFIVTMCIASRKTDCSFLCEVKNSNSCLLFYGDEKVDAQSEPCSSQGKKKRKLSSDKDSAETGSEVQESGSGQQPSHSQDEEPAGSKTGQEKSVWPKC